MISKLNPGEERVLTDPDTQINIPVAIGWDGRSPDKDMVGKTVMRKKDFKTTSASPKLTLEKYVNEKINSDEAHRDENALKTVIDGKRDLGFIALKASTMPEKTFWDEIKKHGLKTINLPLNPYNAFIYFRKGSELNAIELANIANKYGGYLSYEATRDETIRIGQLLGYEESDIQDYVDSHYEPSKEMAEDINVPINVGDTVLGGKFKNKKIVVKDIDKNEKGDITINDKPLLRVRTIKEGYNVYYTKIGAYGGGVEKRTLLNPKPFQHKRAANHFAESQAKKHNIKVDKTHTGAWGAEDVIQIFEED